MREADLKKAQEIVAVIKRAREGVKDTQKCMNYLGSQGDGAEGEVKLRIYYRRGAGIGQAHTTIKNLNQILEVIVLAEKARIVFLEADLGAL